MTPAPSPAQNMHHRIEEWLNSATHGLAALLSVVGTIALIVGASQHGDAWKIVSFSIFGASLILLYMASALYHGARRPELKRAFKTLDHCAIFLLIAGWLITFASSDLVASLSETALHLTIAGGILYTAGVAFYLADRIPYMHAIWHLFVIGGSACHFSAIYFGVLPYTV